MRQLSKRFQVAAEICVGAESVKQRLVEAWTTALEDIGISELPEQLRPEFLRLREAMNTASPQPHECAARASVRKMSQQEAARHTQRILQLTQQLLRISCQADAIAEPDYPETLYSTGFNFPERLN